MFAEQGYETVGFTSGRDALAALQARDFDLLLADLMMPEMDGITLLQAGLALDPDLVGMIMTGQGTVQTAVDAMKVGAFDYILKPFRLVALLPVLARAMEVRRSGCRPVSSGYKTPRLFANSKRSWREPRKYRPHCCHTRFRIAGF